MSKDSEYDPFGFLGDNDGLSAEFDFFEDNDRASTGGGYIPIDSGGLSPSIFEEEIGGFGSREDFVFQVTHALSGEGENMLGPGQLLDFGLECYGTNQQSPVSSQAEWDNNYFDIVPLEVIALQLVQQWENRDFDSWDRFWAIAREYPRYSFDRASTLLTLLEAFMEYEPLTFRSGLLYKVLTCSDLKEERSVIHACKVIDLCMKHRCFNELDMFIKIMHSTLLYDRQFVDYLLKAHYPFLSSLFLRCATMNYPEIWIKFLGIVSFLPQESGIQSEQFWHCFSVREQQVFIEQTCCYNKTLFYRMLCDCSHIFSNCDPALKLSLLRTELLRVGLSGELYVLGAMFASYEFIKDISPVGISNMIAQEVNMGNKILINLIVDRSFLVPEALAYKARLSNVGHSGIRSKYSYNAGQIVTYSDPEKLRRSIDIGFLTGENIYSSLLVPYQEFHIYQEYMSQQPLSLEVINCDSRANGIHKKLKFTDMTMQVQAQNDSIHNR